MLIFKKGDKSDLCNWRPISLSAYKLYAGCLGTRVTEWLLSNGVVSQCQKGFVPSYGAFERVHTLNCELEKVRSGKSNKCIPNDQFDVPNAFGAIPLVALETAMPVQELRTPCTRSCATFTMGPRRPSALRAEPRTQSRCARVFAKGAP